MMTIVTKRVETWFETELERLEIQRGIYQERVGEIAQSPAHIFVNFVDIENSPNPKKSHPHLNYKLQSTSSQSPPSTAHSHINQLPIRPLRPRTLAPL